MDNSGEDQELMYIYEWVDSIPLSRPKKNMGRDFADGVMLAEMIKHHIPKLVELHNYPSTTNTTQKLYNWTTLNNKVLKKIGLTLSEKEIDNIINHKPLAVENLLKNLHPKIQQYLINNRSNINNSVASKTNTSNNNINKNYGNLESSNNNINNKVKPMKNLYEELSRQLEEKKSEIAQLTQELSDLEIKTKNSDSNHSKLNKRISELNEKILKLNK